MLNGALKRRAISPSLCHTALDLRPISLTVQLDEFPDMRCHIEKEGMSAGDHGPMHANPLFTRCRSTHFKAARFKGSACLGTETQILVRTVRVFPRLLLLVVPGSTPSRKSQRNFLVASGASPVITRATAASSHSSEIVRSNPILRSFGHAHSALAIVTNGTMTSSIQIPPCATVRFPFTDEGAKRWGNQSKVVVGQSDTWPFQRAWVFLSDVRTQQRRPRKREHARPARRRSRPRLVCQYLRPRRCRDQPSGSPRNHVRASHPRSRQRDPRFAQCRTPACIPSVPLTMPWSI